MYFQKIKIYRNIFYCTLLCYEEVEFYKICFTLNFSLKISMLIYTYYVQYLWIWIGITNFKENALKYYRKNPFFDQKTCPIGCRLFLDKKREIFFLNIFVYIFGTNIFYKMHFWLFFIHKNYTCM